MTRDQLMLLVQSALDLTDQAAKKTRMGEPFDALPYTYEPYYPFLYCAMATGRFDVALELGTWMGAGTLHLAAGNPLAQVYTVDRDPSEWVLDRVLGDAVPKNISRIVAPTTPPPDEAPREVDLLFVDADHGYDAVVADLKAYLPRVRQGGLVLLDDRHYNDDVRAWDLLCAVHGERAVVLDELHHFGFGAVLL